MPTVQAPPELCYAAAAVVYNCGSGTTHSDLSDLQAGTSSHIVRGQRLQTIAVLDTGEDPGIPQQPRTSGTMCGKTSYIHEFQSTTVRLGLPQIPQIPSPDLTCVLRHRPTNQRYG
jgi:hypothetical protein